MMSGRMRTPPVASQSPMERSTSMIARISHRLPPRGSSNDRTDALAHGTINVSHFATQFPTFTIGSIDARMHVPMTLAEIVARNLQAVRIAQGLPQHVLARRARISVSYISMLERGERTPPLDTLEAVAKALKVSPLYLMQENAAGAASPRRRGRST